jgi:hypothetical protein
LTSKQHLSRPPISPHASPQAGIVQNGGLRPLLELLECPQYNLQHNAAFALYGLSDNEDNVGDMIREGGMQQLLECSEKLQMQASKVLFWGGTRRLCVGGGGCVLVWFQGLVSGV